MTVTANYGVTKSPKLSASWTVSHKRLACFARSKKPCDSDSVTLGDERSPNEMSESNPKLTTDERQRKEVALPSMRDSSDSNYVVYRTAYNSDPIRRGPSILFASAYISGTETTPYSS